MLPHQPRKYDKLVLSDTNLRLYSVNEELIRIYKDYLRLLSGATDIDPEDFEADFLVKVIHSLGALENNSQKYTLPGGPQSLDDLQLDLELVEVLNIIGLNGHRFLNHPLQDIELCTNEYRNGLLRYRHNPPASQEMQYLNEFRCLVRVVVKAHHPEVLHLKEPKDGETKKGCHLLVFENWFGNPSEELALQSTSDTDYLKMSQPRFWRLTDVDGFFNGNSYYRKTGDFELVK